MKDAARVGLEQLADTWRRRRWPALFVFGLVSTLTVSLVSGLPNVYSATATILVEPTPGVETSQDEVQARLHLINEEIQARDRLQGLIDRFGLYSGLRGRLSEVAILERMKRDIRLELKGPDRGAGAAVVAFALAYRAPDAATAARVANALAQAYVDEDARLRGGLVDALGAQLADVKGRLEQQERQVSEFRERFKGELPQQLEVNMATLERLDGQLRVVTDARVRASERRSALLRELAEESSPGAGADARETRLAGLRRQLAELERSYTDKYPDVARLKSEIADLEARPSAPAHSGSSEPNGSPALQTALRDAETDLRSLTDEEQRLRAESRQYRQRVEGTPRLQQELQQRVRDYETTRALYNALLKRLQESQLVINPGSANRGRLRVLEEARAPKEPIAPRRLQLATLGVILALSASAVVIALSEKADTSFHGVHDLQEFTRVPVLAAIPLITGPRAAARRLGLRALIAMASVACLVLLGQLAHRFARNPDVASVLVRGR